MDYLEFVFSGKGNISHILYSNHEHNRIECFSLWSWSKLYSVDNLDSLVGFLSWLGHR